MLDETRNEETDMKRIVLDKSHIKIIGISEVLSSSGGRPIIAYETARKTGLGILFNVDGTYGFRYHSECVMGSKRNLIPDNLKYPASTKEESIKLAVTASRTVLFFDDFQEFLDHAVKFNKL